MALPVQVICHYIEIQRIYLGYFTSSLFSRPVWFDGAIWRSSPVEIHVDLLNRYPNEKNEKCSLTIFLSRD